MEIAGLGDVFLVCQTCESPRGLSRGRTVVAKVQKWLREQDVSSYRLGLEGVVRCDRRLNNFGDYVER
jgi:hypothetical protein